MKKYIKQCIPSGLVRYRCPTREKKIALSFDDGPKPVTTKSVLQTLRDFNMNATFFVLGNMVESNPDLCVAIKEGGNEIGNHGYSHTSFAELSFDAIKQEIERTDIAIETVSNCRPDLFRPPNGALSLPLIWHLRRSRNQPPVLWSVMIKDEWKKDMNSLVSEFKTTVIQPGDIILLHDVNSQTADALPYLLEHIRSLDLHCTSISELL